MLINTVILFLRDLLPSLIFFSLLMVWHQQHRRFVLLLSCCIAVPGAILLNILLPMISNLGDGQGVELVATVLYMATSLLLGIALYVRHKPKLAAALSAVAMASLFCINSSNVLLFLFAYQRHDTELQNLLMGAALGAGIGGSVAVLMYYVTSELRQHWENALWLILCMSGARQVGQAVLMLSQIDVLPTGLSLWDSSQLVSDQSEYGHFFNALFGYEATPGLSHVLSLWLSFGLLYLLVWYPEKKS